MQTETIPRGRYNAILIAGILLPFLLYPFLTLIFIHKGQTDLERLLYSRLLIWGILAALVLYARRLEAKHFLLWKDQPYSFWFYVVSIVSMYIAGIFAGILSNIPIWLGWHDNMKVLLKWTLLIHQHPVLLVFTAITAGITEELIFRGYILTRLSQLIKNNYLPVIISAILFSSVHFNYRSVREALFTMLIGLLYGWHYQTYRNIKILIILHAMLDLIALSLPRPHGA